MARKPHRLDDDHLVPILRRAVTLSRVEWLMVGVVAGLVLVINKIVIGDTRSDLWLVAHWGAVLGMVGVWVSRLTARAAR